MLAMVLDRPGLPLRRAAVADPRPGPDQLLLRVKACGVCRTDLHIVDGELPDPALPLIPGHQIVGEVTEVGPQVEGFVIGDRVGVPWLAETCGECAYCLSGRENLCDVARFTGYHVDGGFAEYAVANARYCFPLPSGYADVDVAPLLCAGLIGYRSLRMAGDAECLGIFGFGSAAHIVAQLARYEGRRVFAFTRRGDEEAKRFALRVGADWAGDSTETPPVMLGAAIIFAPVGSLIPAALKVVAKGGVVVCGGIHMSDIPAFPYELLWGERTVRSVANLTRQDAQEFFALAPEVPVRTDVQNYPLASANEALEALRYGRVHGSAVLVVDGG